MKNVFLVSFIMFWLGGFMAMGQTKQPSLNRTHWVLDAEASVEITLNIEKGKVTGFSGCNNYFGELLTNNKDILEIKNLAVTRKGCDKLAIENDFLNMLEKTNKYTITTTELEFYKDNVLLLKFKKK